MVIACMKSKRITTFRHYLNNERCLWAQLYRAKRIACTVFQYVYMNGNGLDEWKHCHLNATKYPWVYFKFTPCIYFDLLSVLDLYIAMIFVQATLGILQLMPLQDIWCFELFLHFSFHALILYPLLFPRIDEKLENIINIWKLSPPS